MKFLKMPCFWSAIFIFLCQHVNATDCRNIYRDGVEIERRHFSVINSTQKKGHEFVNQITEKKWILISADKQTEGIGRWKRKWISPDGNLFVTYCVNLPFSSASYLPAAATLIVQATLSNYGVESKIRWPNNILVGEKEEKIAGILIDVPKIVGKNLKALIGIGINVNLTQEQCNAIDQPATSLRLLLGSRTPTIDTLLETLSKNLIDTLLSLQKPEIPGELMQSYDNNLLYKGEEVTVFDGKHKTKGTFSKLTEMGFLVFSPCKSENPTSPGKTILSGEISPKQEWL